MIRPAALRPGDTVAVVSLSAGLPAALPGRYEAGKRQLTETFGLTVVDAPHATRDGQWLHDHPEARAADLHWALQNPDVSAVVCAIGGEETIRTVPFTDPEVIRGNPKILLGFSDSTIQHLLFDQVGVVSFYGPSILAGFAENGGIHPYTERAVRRVLFEGATALEAASEWTEEFVDWSRPDLQERPRRYWPNPGWQWLQGEHPIEGRLLGGCIELIEMVKGTDLWPADDRWDGAVFHLELSEQAPRPDQVRHWLRNYAAIGTFDRIGALLLSRPQHYSLRQVFELWSEVLTVLAEAGRTEMPVVANLDYGHSSPMGVLPLGVRARVDPGARTIGLLEPAVTTGAGR